MTAEAKRWKSICCGLARVGVNAMMALTLVQSAAAQTAGAPPTITGTPSLGRGIDPGVTIRFDLERGRFTEPVPFDVPFFLLSPVDATQPRKPVVLLERSERSGAACPEGNTSVNALTRQAAPVPLCTSYPIGPCRLSSQIVKETLPGTTTKADHLEVSVPQLHPEVDYCLTFVFSRKPTDAELQKIAPAIDKVLSRRPGSLTERELAQVCQAAVVAADRALGDQGVDASSAKVQCLTGEWTLDAEVLASATENLETKVAGARTELAALRIADQRKKEIAENFPPGSLEDLTRQDAQTERDALDAVIPQLRRDAELKAFAEQHLQSVRDELDNLIEELKRRDETLRDIFVNDPDLRVLATTRGSFEARFGWQVTADVGAAHAWDIDETFAYIGANFYASPVNKRAPLQSLPRGRRLRSSLALSIGIPHEKLEDPARRPVLFQRPVVVGLGYRINDHLRLSAGGLLFEAEDPDPLVDRGDGYKVTPYVSLSLDFDVFDDFAELFSDIF